MSEHTADDRSDHTAELPRSTEAPTAPDLTTPLSARRVPAPGRSQVVMLFVAVAAAAFLIGLVIATATTARTTGRVVGEGDVDAAGRTIRFDGGRLVVPEGALTRSVHIVVRASPVGDRLRVNTPGDPVVIAPGELTGYRFEPGDLTFREPVEITFELPAGSRNGTIFARRGTKVVLLTGTIDPARSTATTRVRDFRFTNR